MIKNIKEKLAQMRREAEERAAQRQAQKSGCQYVNLSTTPINIEALGLISEETAKKAEAAAIEIKKDEIALAIFNPEAIETKKLIEDLKSKGYKVSIFTVSLSGLKYAWDFYKFVFKEPTQITGRMEIEEKKLINLQNTLTSLESTKESLQKICAEKTGVAEILEVILASALANRASDIHLESMEDGVKMRLRIDGLLHDVLDSLKKDAYNYLLSRIKLLSSLKINIHDEPQDGRFTVNLPGKSIEIRVAIAPSEFGEVVVMRILDPDAISLSLTDLGLREDDLEIIKKELKRPNGMILNTGPTGSGKTTTLYAFLKHKKRPEIKIITIEDPIEYHLEGIEQTQVDEEAGYSFANGLRSLMRQDPDVILVGEIRDKETADIGIQAALTGHLVFSTVHANSASGAIPRLMDLGVKAVSVGPALNLVIGQRLVRRLCNQCKKPVQVGDELKNKISAFLGKLPERVKKEQYRDITIFEPSGCSACSKVGYKGRIAVYEILLLNPEMEELILKQVSETVFHNFALQHQMTTMQQDGILKVILGITTLEEVEGITGPIEGFV